MHFQLPPRPSTRAFIREARRTRGYTFFDWLHGYVYARWPYLYIGIGTGEHRIARIARPIVQWADRVIQRQGAKAAARTAPATGLPAGKPAGKPAIGFADTYHGKVMPLAEAKQLVQVNRDVDLGDLEQIIPYQLARNIILQHPDHIIALDCPCRSARATPCLPLDVCLIIGEPFAGFIAEHQPKRARWVTQEEATGILEAEHARGHVHHAFFKDAMLSRFYAICNCCECCCGAMQAHRNGTPMLAASGYVSVVNGALCAGCGACASSCQFDAIEVLDGCSAINWERCMGCGVCVDKCEHGALTLVRDAGKGLPLEMRALLAEATV